MDTPLILVGGAGRDRSSYLPDVIGTLLSESPK